MAGEGEIELQKSKSGSIGYKAKQTLKQTLEEKPYIVTLVLLGLLLLIAGVMLMVGAGKSGGGKVEIVEIADETETDEVYVDVAGAVMRPGLYRLAGGARVNDALVAAGGLAAEADRDWFSKNINLANKLTDGAKIYIPSQGETATQAVKGSISSVNKINVNTASAGELDRLWGVGPVTAEKIIKGRPYAGTEELLTKKILSQKVYERNKDRLAVY